MGKKKERAAYLKKLQRDGVDITPLIPSKNLFVRFWEWLSGIPRDIRHFFNERKMRKLKLGTVCFKNGMLQTINISWDIHWMSNVYIVAIIRDYLRFFIKILALSATMSMCTIPRTIQIFGRRKKSWTPMKWRVDGRRW